jgi:hypothetical protein
MPLEASVWLPKYWFVLTTIGCTFPTKPNEVTRKKYYELIQNLPLFMPQGDVSKTILELLDKYPVTPYLEDREGFMKWLHFIQNKTNSALGFQERTTAEALQEYYDEYKPRAVMMKDMIRQRERYLYIAAALGLLVAASYMIKK